MTYLVTRGAPYEYTEIATKEKFFSFSQLARVLDPNVYSYVDDAVMAAAQQRGTDLHQIFFYWCASLRGLCPVPARPTEFGNYYDAIGKWIHERKPYPFLLEETSVNRKWGVAGTADAKVRIDNKLWLVDLKTGSPQRIHAVQLNVYSTFEAFDDVKAMATLYIGKDGLYKEDRVYRDPGHLAAAMNAVSILNWRRATCKEER